MWLTQRDQLLNRGLEVWKPVDRRGQRLLPRRRHDAAAGHRHPRRRRRNATFNLAEVKRGVIPGNGGTQRVLDQLPYAIAMEMLLTGDGIDAATAERWGLVNKVVPQAELLDAAYGYARSIAANAPLAVQAAKELAVRSREMDRVDRPALRGDGQPHAVDDRGREGRPGRLRRQAHSPNSRDAEHERQALSARRRHRRRPGPDLQRPVLHLPDGDGRRAHHQDRGARRREPAPARRRRRRRAAVRDAQLEQDLRHAQPEGTARQANCSCRWSPRPTCWSRTSRPARWSGWASATRRCRRSIRGWSTARAPATAAPGRTANYPAMDLTVQAMAGIMNVTGFPDRPPVKAGPAVCDFFGGVHLYGAHRHRAVRAREDRRRPPRRGRDAGGGLRLARLQPRAALQPGQLGAAAHRQPPRRAGRGALQRLSGGRRPHRHHLRQRDALAGAARRRCSARTSPPTRATPA